MPHHICWNINEITQFWRRLAIQTAGKPRAAPMRAKNGRGAANVLKNGAATICLEDARALSRRRRRRRTPLVTIDITRRFAACDAYPQITHSSGWRAPNAAPGNPPLGKDPPGVFFICTKGGGVEQNLPAHVPFPKSSIGGPAPIFWPNFLGKNFGNKNRVV